jgi:hypothetical protein
MANEKDLRDLLTQLGFIPAEDGVINMGDRRGYTYIKKTPKNVPEVKESTESKAVFSGLGEGGVLIRNCPLELNITNRADFIRAMSDGDPITICVDVSGLKYISIRPENLIGVSEYLKALYKDIQKNTTYFEPPVEMTLKDVEKALGFKIKLI